MNNKRHQIEERASPVCMGVQRRVVSIAGHNGPWVCGTMSQVWKAYKQMRKSCNITTEGNLTIDTH